MASRGSLGGGQVAAVERSGPPLTRIAARSPRPCQFAPALGSLSAHGSAHHLIAGESVKTDREAAVSLSTLRGLADIFPFILDALQGDDTQSDGDYRGNRHRVQRDRHNAIGPARPGRQPIYSRNGLLSRCRPVGSATDYMPLPILLERR